MTAHQDVVQPTFGPYGLVPPPPRPHDGPATAPDPRPALARASRLRGASIAFIIGAVLCWALVALLALGQLSRMVLGGGATEGGGAAYAIGSLLGMLLVLALPLTGAILFMRAAGRRRKQAAELEHGARAMSFAPPAGGGRVTDAPSAAFGR